jgi:hypothetical protein
MSEEPTPEAQAIALFPNMGMHRNAAFIASLHPLAIDYLRQAPVLAASFGYKANSRADRLYVASRVGGPIARGERLRNVMSAVQLATPLRKLTGFAVTPRLCTFIRELRDLAPSVLSQAIPEKSGAQRDWLASLDGYRARMRRNGGNPKRGFHWIARYAQHCEPGQAADIADFIHNHLSADIERWSFERMINEVQLWHDKLMSEQSVSKYGLSLKADTVIDLSDWPDHVEHEGFEFFKLSTPSMLMEEGRRMRHCVASYIPRVMNGGVHIYSIRHEMRRMATMEIVGRCAVQVKAFANKIPAKGVAKAADSFTTTFNPEAAA